MTAGYLELQTVGFGAPMALLGQPVVAHGSRNAAHKDVSGYYLCALPQVG